MNILFLNMMCTVMTVVFIGVYVVILDIMFNVGVCHSFNVQVLTKCRIWDGLTAGIQTIWSKTAEKEIQSEICLFRRLWEQKSNTRSMSLARTSKRKSSWPP